MSEYNTMLVKQLTRSITLRSQSHWYTSIWNASGDWKLRVEIRVGSSNEQHHAHLHVWGGNQGWVYFAAVPVEDWPEYAPSYTTKQNKFTPETWGFFYILEEEVLDTWVKVFADKRPSAIQPLPHD